MSEIRALEKLREWSMRFDNLYVTDDGESYMVHSHRPFDDVKSCGECIRDACDEIQAEVDNRFMELPTDADGVPIHVGDRLKTDSNGYSGEFVVFAVGSDSVVGDHDIEWVREPPSKWFHVPDFCHHVKQRTLEDVLDDFNKAMNYRYVDGHYKGISDYNELRAMYTAEIRELMGGDE